MGVSKEQPTLLAIVGPTAGGKTALAIKVATKYNGEIVCADSRTIYKGLNIGTAKPTKEEQSKIRHYGLDLVNPDESFTASDFQGLARGWVAEIQSRGKLPIVVGGTGLYVDSLLYNYSFAPPGAERDPVNPRHLSADTKVDRDPLPPGTVIVGLDPGKEILAKRIQDRAEQMEHNGVVEEAELFKQMYGADVMPAKGNTYRALLPFLQGSISLGKGLEEFIRLDLQLAKRQRTWFKRNKDIQWFTDQKSAEQFLDSILAPSNT